MKRFSSILVALSFFAPVVIHAQVIKTTTTGPGGVTVIHESDMPAVESDPFPGRAPSARELRGPEATQQLCPEGSTDPTCVKAVKRQFAPTTHQQDCAAGDTLACPNR